ncbi:MAG: hypothetical protein HF314_14780 [Ignavibacteria bacterium]|nr:hypothetical protein [Ignavibacteria bacterium]MCU7504344.1 hypothetical protein [Ignavibacteria bacterium]MCU7517567.1 hypothetical protein [Ignavibacteria bacterium]
MMRNLAKSLLLTILFSAAVLANGRLNCLSEAVEKDSSSEKSNNMTIEVNVPEAHTIELELGFVEDGGLLFTRKSDVTIFGTVKTSSKLQAVRVNGRKARFMPEGNRYTFQCRIHLEDEYNTVMVAVTDVNNVVKDMSFTIHRKSN